MTRRFDAEADADSYRQGVEQIYRQFIDILKTLNIEAFGAEGDAFDPNIHSAVMHTEDENVGENVIVKVFTKGYKLGDTVIDPQSFRLPTDAAGHFWNIN